jgi:hypothetical protein
LTERQPLASLEISRIGIHGSRDESDKRGRSSTKPTGPSEGLSDATEVARYRTRRTVAGNGDGSCGARKGNVQHRPVLAGIARLDVSSEVDRQRRGTRDRDDAMGRWRGRCPACMRAAAFPRGMLIGRVDTCLRRLVLTLDGSRSPGSPASTDPPSKSSTSRRTDMPSCCW